MDLMANIHEHQMLRIVEEDTEMEGWRYIDIERIPPSKRLSKAPEIGISFKTQVKTRLLLGRFNVGGGEVICFFETPEHQQDDEAFLSFSFSGKTVVSKGVFIGNDKIAVPINDDKAVPLKMTEKLVVEFEEWLMGLQNLRWDR